MCFLSSSSIKWELLGYRKVFKGDNLIICMEEREVCECGLLIRGISKRHLKFNLGTHKRGKKHKELMEFKKLNLEEKNK